MLLLDIYLDIHTLILIFHWISFRYPLPQNNIWNNILSSFGFFLDIPHTADPSSATFSGSSYGNLIRLNIVNIYKYLEYSRHL